MKVYLVRGTILNLEKVLQTLVSVLFSVPRTLLLPNLHLICVDLVSDLLEGLVQLLLSLLIFVHKHGFGHALIRLLFRPGSLVMWTHTELAIDGLLFRSSSTLIVIQELLYAHLTYPIALLTLHLRAASASPLVMMMMMPLPSRLLHLVLRWILALLFKRVFQVSVLRATIIDAVKAYILAGLCKHLRIQFMRLCSTSHFFCYQIYLF